MEPVTLATVLGSAKVAKAIHDFAADEAKGLSKEASGGITKSLLRRMKPDARAKAAKQALVLFAEEWHKELTDKNLFDAAVPGYLSQLQTLIENATDEIAEWMSPETKQVDLHILKLTWNELNLDPLPDGFDWDLVGQNYGRAIRTYIKNDPELRSAYDTEIHERTLEAAERTATAAEQLAGPAARWNLDEYRKFLVEKKCNAMQLAALHFSTYADDRKIALWNVFVPQSARETIPLLEVPPEVLRLSVIEANAQADEGADQIAELLKRYRSIPVKPILEIIRSDKRPKNQIVITGDPGAGKSALLKYLALKWANEAEGPIPILIDLKEYGKNRMGFLKFCNSGLIFPRLDQVELDRQLKAGTAAFYFDGLDEIFDQSIRNSVVEEIVSFSAEYADALLLVTSRKVGYQPERLSSAGFLHETLEDFDQKQVIEFIHKWYLIAEDDDVKRKQLTGRLVSAIGDSASIRELAGNPLLLTMMAILNRSQELPRNRVTLYRKASEVLLYEWDANRALQAEDVFDVEDKQALLTELAGDMQQEKVGLAGNLIERSRLIDRFRKSLKELGIPNERTKAQALVRQLEERNFILASAGGGYFSFVHRTFLEYFCARWFVNRLQSTRELSLDNLRDKVFGSHWKDQKWHEVLRLIAGMVSEKDAAILIDFLLALDGSNDNLSNVILAAGCLYEVRNRNSIRTTDDAVWTRLTEDACHFDPSGEKNYAFKLEGEDVRLDAIRWIATAWRGEKADSWLKSAAYSDSSDVVQWAAVQELARGRKDSPEVLEWLKERACCDGASAGGGTRRAIEEVVAGWREDPETYKWLHRIGRESTSTWARRAAAVALYSEWPNDPETFALALELTKNDPSWFVRISVLLELDTGSESTTIVDDVVFHHAEHDPSHHVRFRAIRMLGRRHRKSDPRTLVLLLDRAANDADTEVRLEAERILRENFPNAEWAGGPP
jgi:hypothetical protein